MRGRLSVRHRVGARRWTGAALASGCSLLLAAGCSAGTAAPGPSTDGVAVSESAAQTTTPTTPATNGTSTGSPTPAPPVFDGTVVDIVIADGEVTTSQERVIVTLGTVVRLVVASDIDDELHVHGVDESVDLLAGQTVTHDVTANVPGTFEVELHGSGDLLFTLQIQP